MRSFLLNIRRAILVTVAFFVILGLAYPFVEAGIGSVFFHHQVNGSLVANGSTRVGQKWTGAQWFQGRPDNYDPTATGGSNLGPRSQVLVKTVKGRIAQLKKEGITPTPDLVTGSFSGIDPDIAPIDAYAQVNAVAKARHMNPAALRTLIKANIQGPELGFLGATYINVLQLNEALAKLH